MARFEKTLEFAKAQDAQDPLAKVRAEFLFPKTKDGNDTYYFCGNSLGLQPKKAKEYVNEELQDWEKFGVEGHFQARRPWYPYHENVTASLARITGATSREVVAMNSLTVNLHLLLTSFYRPTKQKFKVMMEAGAFPSDQYAVQSQIRLHGFDPDQAIIELHPRPGETNLRDEDICLLIERESEELALVLLGQVNFVTGQAFDAKEISRIAKEHNVVMGLDLAHGVGNLQLKLHDWNVDFAVWCSYKYLNAGPGGIAGCFIHERHLDNKNIPRFEGWWGHNKIKRFEMSLKFDPMPTAEAWQLSNPPILQLACLRASLDVFDKVDLTEHRKKSVALTGYLEFLLSDIEAEQLTPKGADARGCQLSYKFSADVKNLTHDLAAKGFICDTRGQVIRIAPTPLYNRFEDVYHLSKVLNGYTANR